jgi:hypothetical protein
MPRQRTLLSPCGSPVDSDLEFESSSPVAFSSTSSTLHPLAPPADHPQLKRRPRCLTAPPHRHPPSVRRRPQPSSAVGHGRRRISTIPISNSTSTPPPDEHGGTLATHSIAALYHRRRHTPLPSSPHHWTGLALGQAGPHGRGSHARLLVRPDARSLAFSNMQWPR